jgi:hypothetical protein
VTSFRQVKVGDVVTRRLAADGPTMQLKVTGVNDDYIFCGRVGEGWKFDRDYGYEVDEDLGWGMPLAGGRMITGSYLLTE